VRDHYRFETEVARDGIEAPSIPRLAEPEEGVDTEPARRSVGPSNGG
jgi:hypothetical protein